MKKVHLRIFIEVENLGRVMNILADEGVTGFYIVEYRGVSPAEWKGFTVKEDPESAISLIHDYARDAVLVCSVVDEEMVEPIIRRFRDDMGEEKYTIMEIPIKRIIVNSPGT
ncbi:MJ1244 family protein [Methanothermobacter wolfeii]|uniref:MJ1244 family protein n=1 Tax=Methanothermobacter wolfeii TaxID=145261 RepID=UPI0024B3A6B2|nr:MJ1244 family protein [Methanothermobacter wolfeii]MDI6702082.1 MJ1244 family protein [Methanothermobacter wolfeii]